MTCLICTKKFGWLQLRESKWSILQTHAKYTTMYIMFRHEEDHVFWENASSVAQLETRSQSLIVRNSNLRSVPKTKLNQWIIIFYYYCQCGFISVLIVSLSSYLLIQLIFSFFFTLIFNLSFAFSTFFHMKIQSISGTHLIGPLLKP